MKELYKICTKYVERLIKKTASLLNKYKKEHSVVLRVIYLVKYLGTFIYLLYTCSSKGTCSKSQRFEMRFILEC